MENLFIKKYTRETEIGKQYGSLKIIDFEEAHTKNHKKIKAKAIVVCLNCNSKPFKTLYDGLLKKEKPTRSCGCLNPGYTSHGLRHHPYYPNCQGAIARCYPNHICHEYYYDRGITCFWTMKTIADFIKYLEENLPLRQENESLDRIDNDKGYEPCNLRWASKSEQTHNQRNKITNHQFNQLKKENEMLKIEIENLKNELEKFKLALGID